jgi:transcription elongation factor GreA
MAKEPMTIEGKIKLQEQLHIFISVERPAVIEAIAEARGHGDLSENAEYDAAKERQGMIEAKVTQIKGWLSHAEVIDPSKITSDKIAFGATVTLFDLATESSIVYKLVGEDEAEIKAGKLSIHSPLARAMLGKKVDDEVSFKAPGGIREYEVEKIEYI